jgi:hypothetical protein
MNRHIIHEVSRLEVVRTVEYQVHIAQELLGVIGIQIFHPRVDIDLAIDASKFVTSGDGLRKALLVALFVEKTLSLKVRHIYIVPIDEPQVAHAGTNQHFRRRRAQSPYAHDGRTTTPYLALSFLTDLFEKDLTRIPIHGAELLSRLGKKKPLQGT